MRITDFDIYKDLIKEKSGMVLSQDQAYLLESRLTPIAMEWGFTNMEAMTIALQGVAEPKLIDDIVEAMMSNETSFFRDITPFRTFRDKVIPYLLETRIHERGFKIWCAGASSGQEPYSLAMIIKEFETRFSRWHIRILGTDISNEMLEIAEKGSYTQFEVQRGLPVRLLLQHFTQRMDQWRISDALKKMVDFGHFNIMDDMSALDTYDVIFCRNIFKNFDDETKADVLSRIGHQLKDDGFLFLGASETVSGITDMFEPVPGTSGIFAKKGSPHLEKAGADMQSASA